MTDDIVTRLRESADGWEECGEHENAAFEREAADEIERLRKILRQAGAREFDRVIELKEAADEIERLRAALAPFACSCGLYRCRMNGDETNRDACVALIARAALDEDKTDD